MGLSCVDGRSRPSHIRAGQKRSLFNHMVRFRGQVSYGYYLNVHHCNHLRMFPSERSSSEVLKLRLHLLWTNELTFETPISQCAYSGATTPKISSHDVLIARKALTQLSRKRSHSATECKQSRKLRGMLSLGCGIGTSKRPLISLQNTLVPPSTHNSVPPEFDSPRMYPAVSAPALDRTSMSPLIPRPTLRFCKNDDGCNESNGYSSPNASTIPRSDATATTSKVTQNGADSGSLKYTGRFQTSLNMWKSMIVACSLSTSSPWRMCMRGRIVSNRSQSISDSPLRNRFKLTSVWQSFLLAYANCA